MKSVYFSFLKGCVVSVEVKNGGVYEGVLRTVSSKVNNQTYIRHDKSIFLICIIVNLDSQQTVNLLLVFYLLIYRSNSTPLKVNCNLWQFF